MVINYKQSIPVNGFRFLYFFFATVIMFVHVFTRVVSAGQPVKSYIYISIKIKIDKVKANEQNERPINFLQCAY